MDPDERAQLIEDIKRSTQLRAHIIEQAESDRNFDIIAAWQDLDEMDQSISARVIRARAKD